MLVLSRKVGETIVIAGGIRVTVSGVAGNRVKLAIEAPKECSICREEIAVANRVAQQLQHEEKMGSLAAK
ncbi:carbon storage regulator [Planctomicrobium sp. SH527]|uniref:carbon storage regulator n=1 Tax=Planctomicrobium sp. SH527 TaxID=3448123 RepID=UPI003F5B7CFB